MENRPDLNEGTAQVHSHIGVRPTGESAGHDAEADPMQRDSSQPFSDFDSTGDEADLRQRARHLLGGSRRGLGNAIRDAEARLERRTGIVQLVREYPLPALGIAFALGYALAGRSDPDTRLGMAKKRLRKAAVTAVGAAIADEARHVFGSEGGLAHLLELVVERIREPVEEWT